jgi:hypothetical protein
VEAVRKDHDHAEAGEVYAVDTPRGLKGRKGFRPYQYDPRITRPELVGAHTKWLYCSSAFWELGEGQCETRQRYVPDGYWFETGRSTPNTTNCSALTGDGDVPTASCRFKKGLKMVLPVVNYPYVACDLNTGVLEDPRLGPEALQRMVPALKIRKATLDGRAIDSLDALNMILQDGDSDYTLPTVRDRCVPTSKSGVDLRLLGGCPISAGGPYVFIDTKNLTKGAHELILIGEDTSSGFCSAVKHTITLY